MGIESVVVDEIVRRVLSVAQPDRIILFGSAVTDSMNRDSDIDLLVIEPSPPDPRQHSVKIRRALRGMGYPFDIIVMGVDWFEQTKGVIGGIAYPAHKYGRVIYERG
ncbi:MAG: nucleotidyltransferase domain-containing protein [Acidobacteria bacterium]|nr:nucleotidyltransferase domain-containing protein [Acidobacteriota bacterium]